MRELDYKNPKSGTIFKPERGKLYLFNPATISVLRLWPLPMAWRKIRNKRNWTHFRPNISIPSGEIEDHIRRLETRQDETGQLQLPFPLPPHEVRAYQEKMAWLGAFSTIPMEIRNLVRLFPKRQWHMLSFLARCGNTAMDLAVANTAMDLAVANPALAWALASNWVFHLPAVQRPLRSARGLLSKKQRRILSWLGFPETEAARRILAKVVHDAVNVPSLLYVRQAMADPAMFKAMSHLPRLNAGAIRIVTDPALLPFAAPSLLEEIALSGDEDRSVFLAHWLRDSLNMFSQLFPNGKKLQPVRSVHRLFNLHDTLTEEINRARCLENKAPFPPPPVEGTDAIVPITHAVDLLEEGKIMHNCVASYGEQVALHRCVYIYRVLFPERCTLSLRWRGRNWMLSELKRACNEPPSETTHLAVRKWLEDKNLNTPPPGPILNREVKDIPF